MLKSFYVQYGKRIFDFIGAGLGLILLFPVLLGIAIIIKLTSKGPILFAQERVGQYHRKFNCYKFRSMIQNAPQMGLSITSAGDPRITAIGRLLRKTKLDELPQLFNVWVGDMSFVGPRPEVEKYVLAAKSEYDDILAIKPGITDYAAIEFRDEEVILLQYADKEHGYLSAVLPAKIQLYRRYLNDVSFFTDLKLIVLTIKKIFY